MGWIADFHKFMFEPRYPNPSPFARRSSSTPAWTHPRKATAPEPIVESKPEPMTYPPPVPYTPPPKPEPEDPLQKLIRETNALKDGVRQLPLDPKRVEQLEKAIDRKLFRKIMGSLNDE